MSQESIAYAVGRISVLRRDMMDASRLERLLSTSSYEEAKRTLSEIGWSSADETDYEQMALNRVARASDLVRRLSTDDKVTDCFLLKYDLSNLKMLLKARCLGIPAPYLSESGTIPVDKLRHAVADHAYGFLPDPIREAMEELEKELIVQADPLAIDVKLDRAMYRLIFDQLKGTKCEAALSYFRGRVDQINALTLLRVRQMKRDEAFFASVAIDGGTVSAEEWGKIFGTPEKLPALLSAYGRKVTDAAARAVAEASGLPGLEKAMDNALLAYFTPYKYESMRMEPVLGYLLAVEREAGAVRLVMAGKQNGFALDAIRERLRDLYA